MDQIILNENNQPSVIERVIDSLKNDHLVVFPADTVLGIMTSVSQSSITKIDQFKKRLLNKNYALIFDSVSTIELSLSLSKNNLTFISSLTPGYFTFVVKPLKIMHSELRHFLSSDGKIGLRIPKSSFMLEIAKRFGPYIATSANASGQDVATSFENLEKQVGREINQIDLCISCPDFKPKESSTVVDISEPVPVILRQGSGQLPKKYLKIN